MRPTTCFASYLLVLLANVAQAEQDAACLELQSGTDTIRVLGPNRPDARQFPLLLVTTNDKVFAIEKLDFAGNKYTLNLTAKSVDLSAQTSMKKKFADKRALMAIASPVDNAEAEIFAFTKNQTVTFVRYAFVTDTATNSQEEDSIQLAEGQSLAVVASTTGKKKYFVFVADGVQTCLWVHEEGPLNFCWKVPAPEPPPDAALFDADTKMFILFIGGTVYFVMASNLESKADLSSSLKMSDFIICPEMDHLATTPAIDGKAATTIDPMDRYKLYGAGVVVVGLLVAGYCFCIRRRSAKEEDKKQAKDEAKSSSRKWPSSVLPSSIAISFAKLKKKKKAKGKKKRSSAASSAMSGQDVSRMRQSRVKGTRKRKKTKGGDRETKSRSRNQKPVGSSVVSSLLSGMRKSMAASVATARSIKSKKGRR